MLPTSMCDKQLINIGGEMTFTKNTTPTRDAELATPLAHDLDRFIHCFNHKLEFLGFLDLL